MRCFVKSACKEENIYRYESCYSHSGLVDPSELLANIEAQIVKAKEEAASRKDIMDRIDRWLFSCEEENWLEEYNRVSTKIMLQCLSLGILHDFFFPNLPSVMLSVSFMLIFL